MKAELKDFINSADGFKLSRNGEWKRISPTTSYLFFRKDGVRFVVDFSDKNQSSENPFICDIYYIFGRGKKLDIDEHESYEVVVIWFIYVNFSNVPPNGFVNLVKLVKKICKLWKKYYHSEAGYEILRKFAEEQNFIPEFDLYEPEIDPMKMAEKFINEHNLKDDKLRSTFNVLSAAYRFVLDDMVDDI